jgi:hypothetical protein
VVLAGTAAQLIGYELFQGRVPALNSASDGGLFGLVGDISIAMAGGRGGRPRGRRGGVVDADVVVAPVEVVAAVVTTTSWGAAAPVSRLAYRLVAWSSPVSTTATMPAPRARLVSSMLASSLRPRGRTRPRPVRAWVRWRR